MHLWKQLNRSIRNQVMVRILPGLALAFLGLFWLGGGHLIQKARNQREAANARLMEQISESLAHRASNAALETLLGKDTILPGEAPPGGLQLVASASGPPRQELREWAEANPVFVQPDYGPATWSGLARPDDPVPTVHTDQWQILVFPPRRAAGRAEAWLPVTSTRSTPRGAEVRLTGVPLAPLLKPLGKGLSYRLLDDRNQVLATSPGWQGLPDEARASLSNPTAGAAVLRGAGPVGPLVQSGRTRELGIGVQLLDGMSELNRAVLVFLGIGAFSSLAGLFLTGWVIYRVGGRASRQLDQLAHNMEALAAGDYSGRMPQPDANEIGRLIGYFNLMAVSLDEAHRQVNEKAGRLRRALENMRMLDKAKDNFLVLISHEVRTPLTAIMGGADFLRKSVEKAEGPEREILNRLNIEEITGIIQSSGERLSGFMNDAIQMTTLGSAESLLRLQPVPVKELLSDCLGPVKAVASRRNITIDDQLDSDLDWVLLCDPGVMQVGLGKILHNAVQHNREGGQIIIRETESVPGKGAIHEIVSREGVRRMESQPAFEEFEDEELRWKIIEIFNTGAPIPREKRAALFGKFEVLGPIENHQRGTGLSLPIAKAALESHGGGVFLHCDEKDGNTFYLLLPAIKRLPGSRAATMINESLAGHQQGHRPVSTAWNEDIGEVADATPFEVELDDQCATILGCIDEAGGGIDGSSGADHEEKITVTSDLE